MQFYAADLSFVASATARCSAFHFTEPLILRDYFSTWQGQVQALKA